MHSAARRIRLHSDTPATTCFDAAAGRVTLSGSFTAPESLSRMRRTLESALYCESEHVTVDLTGVTQLPARALYELEVAMCLGVDMGRELHVTAAAGTTTAEVLTCAHVPYRQARTGAP
jgi:hypothetical protein